jgi:hypothetical protein
MIITKDITVINYLKITVSRIVQNSSTPYIDEITRASSIYILTY